MLKRTRVGDDAYELRDDFTDEPVFSLTSTKDGDGSLRLVATVSGQDSQDICDGLRLLAVLRSTLHQR